VSGFVHLFGAIGWTGVPEEHPWFLKDAGCPSRPAADRFGVPEEQLSFLRNAGCEADRDYRI